jgi:DNA-damage-inducible protein D
MDRSEIARLLHAFEGLVRQAEGVECWFARDLQALLGYGRWENFLSVLERARKACESSGLALRDHFRDVTKMVALGSGAQRRVEDFALTRYACHLAAQNGGPRNEEIAFAQTYFALQTRRQDLIERRCSTPSAYTRGRGSLRAKSTVADDLRAPRRRRRLRAHPKSWR